MLIRVCTVLVEGDTSEERGHRVTLVKPLEPGVPLERWSTLIVTQQEGDSSYCSKQRQTFSHTCAAQ